MYQASETPHFSFDEHYVDALRLAMRRWVTREYVLRQLHRSLSSINLHNDCVLQVVSLLSKLGDGEYSAEEFAKEVSNFQKKWRIHLDRQYLQGYEDTRWKFMRTFVFGQEKPVGALGRCLDVGCGRGCITASLVREKIAASAVGIDAADFNSEWNERSGEWNQHPPKLKGAEPPESRAVSFKQVQVGRIETWLRGAGTFDTILLFYVLHHAEEYWAVRTLRALQRSLNLNGRLYVLEDSLLPKADTLPQSEDNLELTTVWRDWAAREDVYCLTAAYDTQIILDFVAVQLLAGYRDVRMPCNYRTTVEWEKCFRGLGYEIAELRYIGFPKGRDIDVPQALFVLKLTGGN